MIRPGTDWRNKAPEVLCKSVAGTSSSLIGTGISVLIGSNPIGAAIGGALASALKPALEYGLCGNYESTSPPLDGENELPKPETVLNVEIRRTIIVDLTKPPKQINREIVRRIYRDDDTENRRPGSTKFPLYKAISARESLKDKKFGCILYQPISDEPIKLEKCNIQRGSSDLERQDKERLADFVISQKSTTLAMGVAIMSTISGGAITTGAVVGPYVLSASAAGYAAFNRQMYSRPITKVPKKVEYESCTIPPPTIDVSFSIKKDTQVKFEPFIEITSPFAGVSN
jgi:hypothetical protein